MKYGVFGGSFNPPHNEHKEICIQVKKSLGLDKIIILPCGNAPHKKHLLPFETRCEMTKILFHESDYIIDELENELEGLANSARLLPILKEKYKDITFIIGGDSIIDMDTWIEPEKVMTTCPIAVVAREERSEKFLSAVEKYRRIGSNIRIVDYIGGDVSSTLARTYFALGLPCPFLINELNSYIMDKSLYKNYDYILEPLQKKLTEKRLLHTKYVAIMAVRLNEQLKLPYNKVMISALLHDNAKYSDKQETYYKNLYCNNAYAHAFVGAEEAEKDFGITDTEILDAIRFHTTGRANMSDLEKLIFLADFVEETRTFGGVSKIRESALKDFDKGFKNAIKHQWDYLKGKPDICPLTEECYRYYIKNE